MQQATTLAVDQIGRQATLTIEETVALLGLGRTAAYEAARLRNFATRRLGRRLVVPVPALLAWVGHRDARAHPQADTTQPSRKD